MGANMAGHNSQRKNSPLPKRMALLLCMVPVMTSWKLRAPLMMMVIVLMAGH